MGLVNAFVVRDLRLVTTPEEWRQILGSDYAEDEEDANIVENLPADWTYKAMSKYNRA